MKRLLGRAGGKAAAALLSQGITAGSSLLLQVAAARALGLACYGSFAVALALLVSATAVYTGYVGDSLVVLDRHDGDTRGALVSSALVLLVVACATGFGTLLALRHDAVTAAVYAGTVVLWLLRETGRRLLIARLEFARLAAGDGCYAGVALAAVGGCLLAGVPITLATIFGAMALGAAAGIVTGAVQLPAAEWRSLRPRVAGVRGVASFAAWRALHSGLRPTAQLLARLLVAGMLSLPAVGVLEAGRLVVAPLQVVINGAGSFLLAGFAAGERGRQDGAGAGAPPGRARHAAWLLAGATVAGGVVLAALAGPVGRLLTGGPSDPLLVLGWVAYLAVWAGGLPSVTETVARRRSRAVFVIRGVDSVIGLGLVVAALAAGAGLPAVPWLLAVGGLYAVWRLVLLAARTRGPVLLKTPAPQVRGS